MSTATADEATRRLFAGLEARIDVYTATGTYFPRHPAESPADD